MAGYRIPPPVTATADPWEVLWTCPWAALTHNFKTTATATGVGTPAIDVSSSGASDQTEAQADGTTGLRIDADGSGALPLFDVNPVDAASDYAPDTDEILWVAVTLVAGLSVNGAGRFAGRTNAAGNYSGFGYIQHDGTNHEIRVRREENNTWTGNSVDVGSEQTVICCRFIGEYTEVLIGTAWDPTDVAGSLAALASRDVFAHNRSATQASHWASATDIYRIGTEIANDGVQTFTHSYIYRRK